MNCPCGCKDAETCWRDCCCHSDQEKLAWARDNGVTPPAFVLARVQAAAMQTAHSAKKSCCRSGGCCSKKPEPRICCSSGSDQDSTRDKRLQPSCETVLAIHALRCQGLTYSLSLLPPSIVQPDDDDQEMLPLAGSIRSTNDLLLDAPCAIPDTPPPQC